MLPFYKRAGYGDEKEYRIIARSQEEQGAALLIDMDFRWIKRIYLNPWMPEPLAQTMTAIIKSIDGCSTIKVSQSSLVSNKAWKDAGDKVVGIT
jgi:hypothetical protein